MKENKSFKKYLLFIFPGLMVILILAWLFGWTGGNQKKEEKKITSPTPVPTAAKLSEDEKPEIVFDVVSDRSGGELKVANISTNFSKLEYEIIYTAEIGGKEVERGVGGGPIDIPASRTISENILFGTESCTTGTCKRSIDKNVSGGTIILRLIDSGNKVWSVEKVFKIEKTSQGFKSVFIE